MDSDNTFSVVVESTLSSLPGRKSIHINSNQQIGSITKKFLESVGAPESQTFILRDHEGLILNRTMGVKDAGIKVGAHLYLSTLESERALFSYTNWWLVAAICKFFAVGIMIGSLTAWFCGVQQPFSYITVIDAGSVHTSVFTYRFSGEKLLGTGVIEEASFCEMGQVGISTYIDNPSDIRNYINSTCARKSSLKQNNNALLHPLFLGATAGMRIQRLVDPMSSLWIMGNLTNQLRFLSPEKKAKAEILSGKIEGLNGWVTTNYLKNVFGTDPEEKMVPDVIVEAEEEAILKEADTNTNINKRTESNINADSKRKDTYGALDWGGASAQFTLEVPKEDSNYNITLYGENYYISAQSFLCYGQQEAVNRHRAMMLFKEYNRQNNTLPSRMYDPCGPSGSRVQLKLQDIFDSACTQLNDQDFMNKMGEMNATVEYVGSPDLGQCNDHVLEHFMPQLCESRFKQYSTDIVCLDPSLIISPPNQTFFAMSTFWYLTSALKLPESHDLASYNEKLETVCSLTREELIAEGIMEMVVDTACFKAVFMKALLTEGYHFNDTIYKQIKFVKRVGGADVGWTLGHVVLASNSIPPVQGTIYLSDMMFAALMTISFFFVVLATFFAYQARSINSANLKYQRFAAQAQV